MQLNKKAQLTLFIILGIVILVIFSFIFFLVQRGAFEEFELKKIFPIAFREDPLEIYIKECLEKVTDDSLGYIMINGGQSRLKAFRDEPTEEFPRGQANPLYYQFGSLHVPLYYMYKNETGPVDLSPTIDQLAEQLEDRITLSMPYCLNGYKAFTEQGMQVTLEGKGKTKVIFIGDNKLKAIYYPQVFATANEKSFRPDEQRYTVQSNLRFFYNIIKLIITEYNSMKTNPNGFPDVHFSSLANQYGFTFAKSQLSGSKIILTLAKESIIPGYKEKGKIASFNAAFKYDWEHSVMNPYVDLMENMSLLAEQDWNLGPEDNVFGFYNFSKFSWDVSSYFPEKYDYFAIYSDTFRITPEGTIISSPIFPKFGANEFIVKAFRLEDLNDYQLGKFRINIVDEYHTIPNVMVFNQTDAFKGYDYYRRIWAVPARNKLAFFALRLPPELENMPCGGNLHLDLITGELTGYVTADPGNYNVGITVFQYLNEDNITYVQFNTTFRVFGDYEIEGCNT